MLESLTARGFQIEFLSHAQAILSMDFPEAISELENALISTTVPIEEIIAGGGGEAIGYAAPSEGAYGSGLAQIRVQN